MLSSRVEKASFLDRKEAYSMYSCAVGMVWNDVSRLMLSPEAFARSAEKPQVHIRVWGFTYTLRQVSPATLEASHQSRRHDFSELDELAIHFHVEAQEGTGDDRRDDDPRLGGKLNAVFDADNPMIRLGALVTLQNWVLGWAQFLPREDGERRLGADGLWHMPPVAEFIAACDRHLQRPHKPFDFHGIAEWQMYIDEADIADIELARNWERKENARDFFSGGQGSID